MLIDNRFGCTTEVAGNNVLRGNAGGDSVQRVRDPHPLQLSWDDEDSD